ncbi:MAG: polyribonucleotide nucleotidyltransferase, partial [Peptococcus niger]
MDTVIRRSIDLAGRTLTLETGHLAKQASGSVLVRYGDTVVLVTATGSQEPREGIDFFPLTVDFEEKMYAAGKVPGSFLRREGRASEQATLSARLIDRPIRPLFPKGYRNDVQIVATVLCVEPDNPPDMAAMIGASCALHLSHIPFQGPIAGVHVGYVDGEIMINPNQAEREVSSLDLAVAGTHDAIMMVEAGAQEVSEAIVLEGILEGHKVIAQLTDLIEDMRREALEKGIAKEKIVFEAPEINEAITDAVKAEASDALRAALQIVNKKARDEAIQTAKSEALAVLSEQFEDSDDDIIQALDALTKAIVRRLITHDKIRPDGRALNEVRPLTCEVDLLPRTHGSAVFTRGQTQILSVTTLGSSRDSQPLDGLDDETSRRYLHHYNFPPYSVGETRPIRGPGRRE